MVKVCVFQVVCYVQWQSFKLYMIEKGFVDDGSDRINAPAFTT